MIQNKLITLIFFFSLAFFIYQHSTGFSWDFSSYVLNAKYWLHESHYFELGRPPLMPFMVYALGFFGWASEYTYIIVVTIVHLYSCIKFSEKFNIDKTAFYIFSMSVFTLIFGLLMGTELLSLALTQLFLAYLYEKRSGIFYALSVMARYSTGNFIIFFIFQKNIKRIILSLAAMFAVLSPWLLFNYIKTGNPVLSFIDSYALNYTYRTEIGLVSPFLVSDLILVLNLALPLFVLGVLSKRDKNYWTMLAVIVISIASYASIPLKEPRYLFSLVTPVAYFSAKALEKIKIRKYVIYTFVVLTLLALILMPSSAKYPENPGQYMEITSKNITCMVQSNLWVPLDYYGVAAAPYPEKEQLNDSINSGYAIILFKYAKYPEYVNNESFLHQFPVAEESDYYIILRNASLCKPVENTELVFIDRKFSYYKTLGLNATKCQLALPAYVCNILGK